MPFKNLSNKPGAPAKGARQKIPDVPGTDDPAINEERQDVVPDGSPPIPWPPAQAVDQKPFKGLK